MLCRQVAKGGERKSVDSGGGGGVAVTSCFVVRWLRFRSLLHCAGLDTSGPVTNDDQLPQSWRLHGDVLVGEAGALFQQWLCVSSTT